MRAFCLCALAVCVVARTDERGNSSEAKNTQREITSRLLNSGAFGGLNSTFKAQLSSGDLGSVSLDQVKNLPESFWNIVGAGPLSTLSTTARDYVERYKISANQRLRNELRTIVETNVTQKDAIERLKSTLRDETVSRMRKELLLEKLGNPGDWTEENITNIRDIIFYLPITTLSQIRNDMAIKKLEEEVRYCMGMTTIAGMSRAQSCPSTGESKGEGNGPRALYMMSLWTWLVKRLNGEPENWSQDTFGKMDLNNMPVLFLRQMNPEVVMKRKAEIFTMLQQSQQKRDMVGRDIVKMFLRTKNIMVASNTDVKAALEELRNPRLREKVYRTDLPKVVLDADAQLKAELNDYAVKAIENSRLDAGTLESLMLMYAAKDKFTPTEARAVGVFLPFAPAETLNKTLMEYTLGTQDLRNMATTIQRTAGPSAYGKLMALKNKVLQLPAGGTSVDPNNVPDKLWNALNMRYLRDLAPVTKGNIMAKNVTFTPAQIGTLVSTLTVDRFKDIPGNAKAFVPLKKMENMNKNDIKQVALGMPPMPASSKVGLLYSTKAFKDSVSVDADADGMMYLRAADAKKVDQTKIKDILERMKDTFPTRGACNVLRDKLVNNSMQTAMTSNFDEVFQLISPMDVETVPICVVAAFGMGRVSSLPDISKSILLDRLIINRKQVLSTDSLERPMVEHVIREGLNAKGWPTVMTAADVERFGELLLFAPMEILNMITEEAAPTALRIFNMLASSFLMPCLDGGRRGAISSLVSKALGDDPSQWTDLYSVCCLLYTLSSGQLSQAPKGALIACDCPITDEMQFSSEAVTKEINCYAHIGGDYDGEMWNRQNVKRMQAMATIDSLDPTKATVSSSGTTSRRKRATSDVTICNRASVNGVDDISDGELNNATPDQVMRCLAALGSRYMSDSKAKILAEKVRQQLATPSYRYLTNDLIRDMNFIMKGISSRNDIELLPPFKYIEFDDAVAVLGNPEMMLSDDQLRMFADRVIGEGGWRRMSEMTGVDITTFNRLLCATNETFINQLNNDAYEDALAILGRTMEGCDRDRILRPLAAKAKSVISIPADRATMQELGVIVAGMIATDIRGLPNDCFNGLTPSAMRAMTNEAVGEMNVEQIRNLAPITARAMSGGQISTLSGEEQQARSESLAGSGATRLVTSSIVLALTVVAAVVRR